MSGQETKDFGVVRASLAVDTGLLILTASTQMPSGSARAVCRTMLGRDALEAAIDELRYRADQVGKDQLRAVLWAHRRLVDG